MTDQREWKWSLPRSTPLLSPHPGLSLPGFMGLRAGLPPAESPGALEDNRALSSELVIQ